MYGRSSTVTMTVEAEVEVNDFLENMELDELAEYIRDNGLKEEFIDALGGTDDDEAVERWIVDTGIDKIVGEIADHRTVEECKMLGSKFTEEAFEAQTRRIDSMARAREELRKELDDMKARMADLEKALEPEKSEDPYPGNEFPTDGMGATV